MTPQGKTPLPTTAKRADMPAPTVIDEPYELPSLDLLDDVPEDVDFEYNDEVSHVRIETINEAFRDFGVKAEAISYTVGPSVTSFDIKLERTTYVKEVTAVLNEISIRLGGMPALFNEIVPGKTMPTLEVPNEKISIVSLKEIIREIDRKPEFIGKVVLTFGKSVQGEIQALPLKDIVHMMVAGTTGSGKSVFLHTLMATLLLRNSPKQVRILIIDPKHVEFKRYEELPHLLGPIITDYAQAKMALIRLMQEMKDRYDLFKDVDTTNIDAYNRYASENGQEQLPLIVAVIDEYANLADGSPAISEHVEQLASMARAAGIHLVVAMQRPTTKVISGNIKNNITTKVALQMNAQVDSITILGHAGAEKLYGNGDMLLSCPRLYRHGEVRLQGAFVSDDDTIRIANAIKKKYEPDYDPRFMNLVDPTAAGPAFPGSFDELFDERYEEIKQFALTQEYITSNRILRDFKMGFNRVMRIIKRLQAEGVLASGPEHPQSNKGIKVMRPHTATPEEEG